MGDGIPIRLLHEAVPHVVTVETRGGDTYRGTLASAEDNMNLQLKRAVRTRPDGRVQALDHVFIRGSSVRLLILPDILSNAPMFKRVVALKEGRPAEARGLGRGRGFAAAGRGVPLGGGGASAGRGAGRGAPPGAGGGRGAPR
jgi:small nuclear ribonucleoprotein D3